MNYPAMEVAYYEREGYVGATVSVCNDGPHPDSQNWNTTDPDAFIRWRRRVEFSISPTGRSVRIWVDGNEIPARPTEEGTER